METCSKFGEVLDDFGCELADVWGHGPDVRDLTSAGERVETFGKKKTFSKIVGISWMEVGKLSGDARSTRNTSTRCIKFNKR